MSKEIDRIVAESMKNIEKIERQSRAKEVLISEEKRISQASAETMDNLSKTVTCGKCGATINPAT